jgi:hypothetical protein
LYGSSSRTPNGPNTCVCDAFRGGGGEGDEYGFGYGANVETSLANVLGGPCPYGSGVVKRGAGFEECASIAGADDLRLG